MSQNQHSGPLRPEQDTDFELGQFNEQLQIAFSYPNLGCWLGPESGPTCTPAPALGNVSATGYDEPVPHDYSAEVGQPTPCITSSAHGSPHPDGFSMQQNPTSIISWNPTCTIPNQPSPRSHFHKHGPPTWTTPADCHVSNTSSLLESDAFVSIQVAGFDQRSRIMQSSHGFRSAMNPIATYSGQTFGSAPPEVPHQTHLQDVGQSTLGHRSFIQRHLPHLPQLPHSRRPTVQNTEACWRCKSSHTKVRT